MVTDTALYWFFPLCFAAVTLKYLTFLPVLIRLHREIPEHADLLRSYAWVVAFCGFVVLPGMIIVSSYWISRHAGAETGVEGALWAGVSVLVGFALWVLQCALATSCRYLQRLDRVRNS